MLRCNDCILPLHMLYAKALDAQHMDNSFMAKKVLNSNFAQVVSIVLPLTLRRMLAPLQVV